MTEPTTKAMPPRTKCSCHTSTAATRQPTSPVSEIAFGVSRDSMSRLRARSRRSAYARDRASDRAGRVGVPVPDIRRAPS